MFSCILFVSLSAASANTDIDSQFNASNISTNQSESQILTDQEGSTQTGTSDSQSNQNSNATSMAAGSEAIDYFTVDQLKDAASGVRTYVETNRNLPDFVTIGSTNVTMSQFLELLTTTLLQINNGNNNSIPLFNFTNASNPKEDIMAGYIYKADYLKLASDIKNYMDSTGKTPDYAYGTSIGPYLRFENLVYMYSMILDYYHTSGKLASWAAMEPWAVIRSKPVIDPNAPKFNVDQIKNAASTVRTYVETYNNLPDKVNVNGTDVSMPQFLELLTSALIQINSGNNDQILLRNFTGPVNPKENINSGNIYKAEYMKLAGDIKNYMDFTGKSPDYAYGTSIGPYLRFENLVYMYSMILDYYNNTGNIAGWAAIVPWSTIISRPVLDLNAPKFTVTQIKAAASTVRANIENDHKLPDKVTIDGIDVTMPQFLELLTNALIQINSGTSNPILLRNFSAPINPKEDIAAGNMYKSEYLKLASDIKNYMDSTGKSPDYAYKTSLGNYLRFENLVYMYAMILDYYNTSGKIAGWATMRPWSIVTRAPITTFTLDQILVAATDVRSYIETNKKLPDSIQISTFNVSMSQLLELFTTGILQINAGDNHTLSLYNYSTPTSRRDDISQGNICKAEYLKLASDIKNFMDSNGKAPNYAYKTSLGNYFGFWNLVYMYSMILDYYHTSGKMADYAAMKPWNVLGSTDYGWVEKLGPFGNTNSPVKIAYIVGVHPLEHDSHEALIETLEENDCNLNYCYYIYKVTVTRDASNYDIGRMNGQLLANKFVVPDALGEKFNLVVDVHSNVGNWQYRKFVFSPISGTSSESFARTIKDRIGWLTYYYPPNPTSTQYVTVPLIQGGVPAFVYEVYTYDAFDTVKNQAYQVVMAVNNLFS